MNKAIKFAVVSAVLLVPFFASAYFTNPYFMRGGTPPTLQSGGTHILEWNFDSQFTPGVRYIQVELGRQLDAQPGVYVYTETLYRGPLIDSLCWQVHPIAGYAGTKYSLALTPAQGLASGSLFLAYGTVERHFSMSSDGIGSTSVCTPLATNASVHLDPISIPEIVSSRLTAEGNQVTVQWNVDPTRTIAGDTIRLKLINGGQSTQLVQTIIESTPHDGLYGWTVSRYGFTEARNYSVMVELVRGGSVIGYATSILFQIDQAQAGSGISTLSGGTITITPSPTPTPAPSPAPSPTPIPVVEACYEGTTRDLYLGVSDGTDVKNLQQVLNRDSATQIAASGPGSSGNETNHFGSLTESAVKRFQVKYSIVSSGTPDTTGYGRVGPRTRTKLIELYGCAGTQPAGGGMQPGAGGISNGYTITAPAAGEKVPRGKQYTIRWTTNLEGGSGVNIKITKDGSLLTSEQYGKSCNPFGTVCVGSPILSSGSFAWNVPATLVPASGYGIVIESDDDATLYGYSAIFSIVDKPTVQVVSPNGGELLSIDSSKIITWTKSGNSGSTVDIRLKKGNVVVGSLSSLSGVSNSGSFTWNIVGSFITPGNDYKIVIGDRSDATVFDESNTTFTIGPPPVNVDLTSVALGSSAMTIDGDFGVAYTANLNNKSSILASDIKIAVRIDQTGASRVAGPTALVQCAGNAPGIAPSGTCLSTGGDQGLRATNDQTTFGFGQFVPGPARAVFQLRQGETVLKEISVNINLLPKPKITVKIPNGGEAWEMGGQLNTVTQQRAPYPISWMSEGIVNPVTIYLKQVYEPRVLPCNPCDLNADGVFSSTEYTLTIELKKYDINGDLKVDWTDLDVLQNVNPDGSGCPRSNCDLNGDGSVRANDRLMLSDFMYRIYDLNNDGKLDVADKDIVTEMFFERIFSGCTDGKLCNFNFDVENQELAAGIHGGDVVGAVLFYDNEHYIQNYPEFDLDNDGKATLKDKIFLEAVAVGTKPCLVYTVPRKSCDLDHDGVVAGTDVTIMRNHLAEIGADKIHEGVIAANRPTAPGVGGTYPWKALDSFVAPAENYKIMIYDSVDQKVVDESDRTFSIASPAPTIVTPTENQVFKIDNKIKITLNVTHPLFLTRYRVKLYQKDAGLIYESGDSSNLETIPFMIDANLTRKSDGKKVLDLLREGSMLITAEGLMPGIGYTKLAVRTVRLEFDRKPPTIISPKANEEISLGDKNITIRATHPSQPTSYQIIISQNNIVLYQNDSISAPLSGLNFTIDRSTEYAGHKVFDQLDEGPVLLAVKGNLLQGQTQEARQIFRVIPIPVNFDLNDDGLINSSDLNILQGVVVYEKRLSDALREGRPLPIPDPPGLEFSVRPCPTTKNCDLDGSGQIDSRDAAKLSGHPAFREGFSSGSGVSAVGGTTLAVVATSIPQIASPMANASWQAGAPQNVTIKPFSGATGYLVGFARNNAIVYENYKHHGSYTLPLIGGNYVFTPSSTYASLFTPGPMLVYVRGLVNNQWTEAAVANITIR